MRKIFSIFTNLFVATKESLPKSVVENPRWILVFALFVFGTSILSIWDWFQRTKNFESLLIITFGIFLSLNAFFVWLDVIRSRKTNLNK